MAGRADAVRWGNLAYDGKVAHLQAVPQTAWAVSAVNNLGGFVAPCDLTLEEIRLYVGAAATSAAALINIGADDDIDAILQDYSMQNVGPGKFIVPLVAPQLIRRNVVAGEYIYFNMEAATAVGNIAAGIVWSPTQ